MALQEVASAPQRADHADAEPARPHDAAPIEALRLAERLPPRKQPEPLFGASLQLSQALRAAQTAAEREQHVRLALEASPFDWLGYTRFRYAPGGVSPIGSFASFDHAEWAALYFSQRFHRIDPRLRRDRHGAIPVVWDIEDVIAALPWDPERWREAERFANGMRDAHIGSGVCVLFPSEADPRECTSINLMSRSPSRRWIGDGVAGHAMALGLCLHEFIVRPGDEEGSSALDAAAISPLQQRILDCVRRGYRDRDIALSLDLSIHTLDYQLRLLRRRLGARNRAQMVQVATENGLLV